MRDFLKLKLNPTRGTLSSLRKKTPLGVPLVPNGGGLWVSIFNLLSLGLIMLLLCITPPSQSLAPNQSNYAVMQNRVKLSPGLCSGSARK